MNQTHIDKTTVHTFLEKCNKCPKTEVFNIAINQYKHLAFSVKCIERTVKNSLHS